MYRVLGILSFFAVSAAFAATPVVVESSVRFEQGDSRVVTITYDLEGSDAVVTVDIQTNGVSIGAANFTNMEGDVNRLVRQGVGRTVTWEPWSSWPDQRITDNSVTAVVTAWATNAPPPYMAVDLRSWGNVNFYVSAEAVPGGVGADIYKTTKMLMRRCPAAGVRWRTGAPPEELSDNTETEKKTMRAHYVAFSEDFYIGVYELTQAQYVNFRTTVEGSAPTNPSKFQGDKRPLENYSYDYMRGSCSTYRWDQDGHAVSSTSPLARLRSLSGIDTFDLPTEAQWEFACRAGTMSALYNGHELFGSNYRTDLLDPIAVYRANSNSKSAPVGTKEPNAWGLYDTLGNLFEWCLDRLTDETAVGFQMSPDAVIDPLGAETGNYRVRRGGCMASNAVYNRASYRSASNYTSSAYTIGFRVALRIP